MLDNNLILMILIAIILFIIYNLQYNINDINDKSIEGWDNNKKNYTEMFNNNNPSPLLNTNRIKDNELVNNLYANTNIEVNKDEKVIKTDDPILEPPPLNKNFSYINKDLENNVIYKDFNKQIKFNDDDNIKTSYDFTNDQYMIKPAFVEEKFDKVISKEKRTQLISKDLLPDPNNTNTDWFQIPNEKFNLLQAVELEIPEIKIGIDTCGQSRKNATYDLRAAPPNPKFVVSPWSNSTIEPDYNTKPLC